MESPSAAVLDAVPFDPVPPAATTQAPSRTLGWPAVRPARVLLAAALAAAALHAWLLGDWLIDDAGITFAYARHFALGHGLVSQPGVAPVEGFSNPLWTLLLAPFFAVGLFHPVWTPKLLSLALIAGAGVLIAASARGAAASAFAAAGLLLLALDTSFVIWTMSGLENPLLAFLLAASAAIALRSEEEHPRLDAAAGVIAGLLALTRPDAILYAAAYPIACRVGRPGPWRAFLRTRMVPYALNLAAVFTSYLVFRRAYFGDWVPNTYHAKVRPWLLETDLARALELARAAAGPLAWPALLLVAAAAVAGLRWASARRVTALAPYLLLAAASYVLLPPDWMGEHRFGTGFFIFFYWALGEALAWLWSVTSRRPARLATAAAALGLALHSIDAHAARTADFAQGPTVPFARIRAFAEAYNRLARSLGPGTHSLLTPDLGGMLFDSDLRIYDLAGLCDRTVARTLMSDGPAFRDYVFETARPTFIHVHGAWADWAALHTDSRFARDYAVLHETWERPRGAERGEGEPWAGDYIRRDAVGSPEHLEHLVRTTRRLGIDRPLP